MTAVTGDVHVDVPGMVVFRDTVTYVPEPEVTVRFSRADTLYLLNYLGEGFLVWWLHGRCPDGTDLLVNMARARPRSGTTSRLDSPDSRGLVRARSQ